MEGRKAKPSKIAKASRGRGGRKKSARPPVAIPRAEFARRIAKEKASQASWILAQKIADLERRQRIIWSWNVTGAIVLFFIIFAAEAGSWVGWWEQPSGAQAQVLEYANLIAILIFALDLAGRYRTTTNKLAFLRNNAIGIIAILPMGMILRMGQALESAAVLREASIVARMEDGAVAPMFGLARNTQLAAHFQKTAEEMPKIAAMVKEATVELQAVIANFSVVTEFLEKVAQWVGRALRILE